jgi:galactokinase
MPLNEQELDKVAQSGTFNCYVAGTAAELITCYQFRERIAGLQRLPGIFINNYETSLPMQKGLSSSAAICVLVATCFNKVFSLGLSMEEIMDLAYRGEKRTPSGCGRMDQCGQDILSLLLMSFSLVNDI